MVARISRKPRWRTERAQDLEREIGMGRYEASGGAESSRVTLSIATFGFLIPEHGTVP